LPPEAEFVFGYGSLAGDLSEATLARLPGHRRTWGVAMDNGEDLPGYKHYVTPAGDRPGVRVCFLDLEPDPGTTVNGVCLPVSEPDELDARERNYVRRDVSELIEGAEGRVWTYFGSPEGRRRRHEGEAVISREYLEAVEEGFRRLGPAEHRAFLASTELDTLPVWDLERVDHPA
jgi:hypothetical protein